jgi:hypothetical protein
MLPIASYSTLLHMCGGSLHAKLYQNRLRTVGVVLEQHNTTQHNTKENNTV